MLIDSPRLKPGDREAWDRLESYDRKLARSPRLADITRRAQESIRTFAGQGACYASTSWGKDSTVIAHLAATSGLHLPLVYVRMRRWESPECLTVRDAFLAKYGDHVDYHEYWVDGGPRWWHEPAAVHLHEGTHVGGQFAEAERNHGGRHISGIRAEESRMRGMVMARWGDAGPNACRPIGRWTAVDVFTYLALHELPVHPAYAMSMSGHYDRRWLRVSPIGGITQAHKQRADWESAYYPDIVGQPL